MLSDKQALAALGQVARLPCNCINMPPFMECPEQERCTPCTAKRELEAVWEVVPWSCGIPRTLPPGLL